MDKNIMLDGSLEERIKYMKEFFGFRLDQSFQEIDVDIDDKNADVTE